ncbi:MAG: hypothetical protein ACE5NM_07330 [Sedimentisphaerales bacterium]
MDFSLTNMAVLDIVRNKQKKGRFKDDAMNTDMYDLIERIMWGVSFIAIGGAIALIFFLLFAQSILGSRTIHEQLEKLLRQGEQISKQLKQIGQHLEKEKENTQNKL